MLRSTTRLRTKVVSQLVILLVCGTAASDGKKPTTIDLPSGKPGIGFDDLNYSPRLKRVLAPAGRSGNLVLVDPASRAVIAIGGFSKGKDFDGGHDFGVTSVDDTGALLAVADRTTDELVLVDPAKKAIGAKIKLGGGPDYVRWVAETKELWVTEPDREAIEVFSLDPLKSVATIAVKGGPESLVIDHTHARAYTHLWKGSTVAIDLKSRAVGKPIANGCKGSRGIAVDEPRELVFAGCADGTVTALHGDKVVASLKPVSGMDIIAYSPAKHHLYLAGAESADSAIVGVGEKGELKLLGKGAGAAGGHCVTTDDAGHAYVCDPKNGRLIEVEDSF
jgi:DNA-binding beta-propeller fold protein YncE